MATSSIGKVVKLDKESGAKLAKVMASKSTRVRGTGVIDTAGIRKSIRCSE